MRHSHRHQPRGSGSKRTQHYDDNSPLPLPFEVQQNPPVKMKKMFGRKKEITPEQNRDLLEETGITIGHGFKRPSKFSQFSTYARNVTANENRHNYAPGQSAVTPPPQEPPMQQQGRSSNPYANAAAQLNYQGSVPSGNNQTNGAPSYHTNPPSKYGDSPYASAEHSYANRFGTKQANTDTDSTYERNREELFGAAAAANGQANGIPGRSTMNRSAPPMSELDELNATESELSAAYPQKQQSEPPEFIDSEDEDVEAIKGQIKFTKQQSVNSTRNALRMAAEAEESGRNTLGMLGAQGERIASTEHYLSLADTQNKIAEEKARELKTLNRSIFAVHVSNPFGAKRRLQEKEEQIRTAHRMGQVEREDRRKLAYDSQQRVQNGLQPRSALAEKYRPRNTEERKKHQFEEDSEDEEMENEIDSNLDAISSATGRLKKLAMSTSEEVARQNDRLDKIAASTDQLDTNVHLNTSRLANIK
ncbi:hypothetical protein TRVA0_010S03048 [Trichomonascus vanleenenianus]|uniref:uncharacterized protein n=1 Tax=Trichomonascus vanleenenianus TaxID=2268995 RepID=UPI003ECB233F